MVQQIIFFHLWKLKIKNFSEVLNKAKKLGFAESNPISDLNGSDSAAKLRILSSLAFNKSISKNKILTEGIQNINLNRYFIMQKNLGYKIKLLSISEIIKQKINGTCSSMFDFKAFHYIAKIDGVLNAVVVDGLPIGKSAITR